MSGKLGNAVRERGERGFWKGLVASHFGIKF
jgi:hypothetical protein